MLLEELVDQARLADPRLTDHRHQPAALGDVGVGERLFQDRQLAVTPDERGLLAVARRRPRSDLDQPVCGDALGLALELERLDRLDVDLPAHELVRELADEHLVGGRGLFEPRRGVHCVAGDEALTGRDIARDDLAGVDAGPVRELHAVGSQQVPVLSSRSACCMPYAARTARSASSSCSRGRPKTAMIASPMYFSIVPPWRSRTAFIESK